MGTEKPIKPKLKDPVWYRPDGVSETGLAFIGHQFSEDGENFLQYLHYDLELIRITRIFFAKDKTCCFDLIQH